MRKDLTGYIVVHYAETVREGILDDYRHINCMNWAVQEVRNKTILLQSGDIDCFALIPKHFKDAVTYLRLCYWRELDNLTERTQ